MDQRKLLMRQSVQGVRIADRLFIVTQKEGGLGSHEQRRRIQRFGFEGLPRKIEGLSKSLFVKCDLGQIELCRSILSIDRKRALECGPSLFPLSFSHEHDTQIVL